MTKRKPFYQDGLQFSCTRCSMCCRFDPGYVFLSEEDVMSLTRRLDISRDEFEATYCRQVEMDGSYRLSLTEQANNDCIFWKDGGCSVYEDRPLQCRSFPFWPSYLFSEYTWKSVRRICPGVGLGKTHEAPEIEEWLRAPGQHSYIRTPKAGSGT